MSEIMKYLMRKNKQFNSDYDSGGKASLSSMCEIVVEACQSWFPQDKK